MAAASTRLVILYGMGGLSDVGRHAIQVALEREPKIDLITILTQHPELLEENNWDCACPDGHFVSEEDKKRLKVITVTTWPKKGTEEDHEFTTHFSGASAVVACLGNRQPGFWDSRIKNGWVSYEGNQAVIRAMEANGIARAVVISSVGIEEDRPPLEFHWAGKIMSWMFATVSRRSFDDLTSMERAYRNSKLDFLLVRPVGISQDVKPVGRWVLQKEKGKDTVGFNMAKMDVARFMIEEALNPSRHKTGVVIGAELP